MTNGENLIIGATVRSLTMEGDKARLVTTDRGAFVLEGQGDCCANCWIEHLDGIIEQGAKILAVKEGGWRNCAGSGDVNERGFYSIDTTKGTIQIDLRLEHNGYY